jgi:arylsulfatase A-like enzyme
MYSLDEVDIAQHHKLDLDRRPWWHRASLEGEPQMSDGRLANHRKKVSRVGHQTDRQLRHMTANYYGMISMIDHNVGRILAHLEESGLSDDTIVVYTTDHGEFLGDHGLYLKGPMLYDGLIRIGMVVSGPGVAEGKVVSDPVSTLDLAATIYDFAGIEQPDDIQSQNLRPLIETDKSGRDVAYCEWNMLASRCGVELQLRTVRTRDSKLTLEQISGCGELYDLKNDPHEMVNVFDDPAYRHVRHELEDMIRARPGTIRETFATPVGAY